jgi:hypothetical protein
MFYEYAKGTGNLFDREIEVKFWSHPAKVAGITAAQEESKHNVHGSKIEGVGAGIAILPHRKLTDTIKYRLNGRFPNNQA